MASFPRPFLPVPPLVSRLVAPVFWLSTDLQKPVLEAVLRRLLSDAMIDGATDFLSGRWVQIVVKDIGVSWFVTVDNKGPRVSRYGVQPDVTISGNVSAFVQMTARTEDPDALFFQRRLVIEGDTELGLNVKNLIDSVDFDRLPKPVSKALGASAVLARGKR